MNANERIFELPKTNRGGRFVAPDVSYKLNDKVQLNCYPKEGFKPLANKISTVVRKNGKLAWDPPEINCEPISELTELPKTQNRNRFECDERPPYFMGDTARLVCDVNSHYRYPPRVTSTVVVKNGQLAWQPNEIKCIPQICQQPKQILNGRPNNLNFHFPESFSYECDPGYRFNKSLNKFHCSVNGEWTPKIPDDIACEPITCPSLKRPRNGFLRYTDGQKFDSVATFACDQDYAMIKGTAQRVCQEDGTWSGEDVTCAQLPCPPMDPSVKVTGNLSGDNGRIDMAFVDCGKRQSLAVLCFPTGWWLYEHPYCNRITERKRLAVNPVALAEWESMQSKAPPSVPIPNVPIPAPAPAQSPSKRVPPPSAPVPPPSAPVPPPSTRAPPPSAPPRLRVLLPVLALLLLFLLLLVARRSPSEGRDGREEPDDELSRRAFELYRSSRDQTIYSAL